MVSTRLNWNTFWTYFSKHLDKLCGSLWKCVHIDECVFGRSKYSVNVWFRTSPMQPSCNQMHNIVDNRMHKLLAGLFLLLTRNLDFVRCFAWSCDIASQARFLIVILLRSHFVIGCPAAWTCDCGFENDEGCECLGCFEPKPEPSNKKIASGSASCFSSSLCSSSSSPSSPLHAPPTPVVAGDVLRSLSSSLDDDVQGTMSFLFLSMQLTF